MRSPELQRLVLAILALTLALPLTYTVASSPTHSYGQRLTPTLTPSCMLHSLIFFDAQSLDSLALIVVLISSPRFAVFCCVRMSKLAESCGAPWTFGAPADIHGMG